METSTQAAGSALAWGGVAAGEPNDRPDHVNRAPPCGRAAPCGRAVPPCGRAAVHVRGPVCSGFPPLPPVQQSTSQGQAKCWVGGVAHGTGGGDPPADGVDRAINRRLRLKLAAGAAAGGGEEGEQLLASLLGRLHEQSIVTVNVSLYRGRSDPLWEAPGHHPRVTRVTSNG